MTTLLILQRRRFPLITDLAFTAVMLALTVLGSIGESHPNASDHLPASAVAPAPAYLLVAAGSIALFWRYRRPVAAWGVALLCTLVYTAFGYENGAALLNPVCALYTVVVTESRPKAPGGARSMRGALIATAVTFVALAVVTSARDPFGVLGGSAVLIPGEVAIALFAGLAVASQRAYFDAMRQRAEDAERSREEEARRRVDAERLRIARELHDVVAHTMSTINLQAGVAVHVSRDLPEPVAAALGTIRDASKNGLRELRAILAVLRQADDAEPTAPTPDLEGLPALLDTVRASGLPVTVEITGERRRLPAAVELAAYRIVQESLTNTLRHAGPATATVRISYGEDALDVQVTDDGAGLGTTHGADAGTDGADHGSGHGLIGMRERALATGGTLQAHRRPEGGFRVRAELPLGDRLPPAEKENA